MRSRAQIMVAQPLSVVESHLWDVASWPSFIGFLESAVRNTHERYTVQIRHRWHHDEAVIRVRWRAKDHRVTWQTEQGLPWSGEFSLTPVGTSNTLVTLSTSPAGNGPTAWMSHWLHHAERQGEADLARLKQRLEALPQPRRIPSPRPGTNAAMNDLAEVHRLGQKLR